MCETRQTEDGLRDAGIDGFEPEFISVDGINTRYYEVGTGDPLVLVHGGNWSGHASANRWTRSFEHLAKEFRVIAFDRIGCGLTDNPPDTDEYRYESEMTHARKFVDSLGLSQFHLAGYSRGAGLATRLAVESPERVSTLILTNSATLGPPIGDEKYRHNRHFRMDALPFSRYESDYHRYRFEQYVYDPDCVSQERCEMAALLESTEKAREMNDHMEHGDHKRIWTESLRDAMRDTRERIGNGSLQMPILYVFGRNDMTVPLEMATGALDLFGKCNHRTRLEILNRCGHMPFLELPAEFSQRVINFIDYWKEMG